MTDRPPVDAVLFDLDDTLFIQSTWLDGAWCAVADAASAQGADRDRLLRSLQAIAAEGSARGRIIDRALQDAEAQHVQLPPLLDAFRSHAPGSLPCVEGADDAIARLADVVPVALVSDGDPTIQAAKLRAVGLERHFSTIVWSDTLGREHRKPDPAPFAVALNELGVAANRAVYVGDNPVKDVAGAAAAGMPCVRVRTGEYAELTGAVEPLVTVDDVTDAVAWIERHCDLRPVRVSPSGSTHR